MAEAVQRADRRVTVRQWATTAGIFGVGQSVAAMGLSMGVWEFSLGISSVALVVATGNHLLAKKAVEKERAEILSERGMARLLKEEYHMQLVRRRPCRACVATLPRTCCYSAPVPARATLLHALPRPPR